MTYPENKVFGVPAHRHWPVYNVYRGWECGSCAKPMKVDCG